MLKYLFKIEYEDGSVFEQPADDKSTIEPEKRSSFFDALKIGETKKMVRFELHECSMIPGHKLQGGDMYAVDLVDGHFEVNGTPFFLHEQPIKDLRVIFFRQHTHTYRISESKTVQGGTTRKELEHNIVYRMGWQCTIDGKNYQQVMQFI